MAGRLMMIRFFAFLSLAFILVVPAYAQSQLHRYNGIAAADGLNIIDNVAFDYDVELNLGRLLGEPVVGSRFRWRINVPKSQATIPAMGIGEDTYETVPLATLGSRAPSKVRIHSVKIEYQLRTAAGTLYLLSDAGDPAAGDGRSWSFNVPGSPNWAKMFHRSPMKRANASRSFVSASTAKSAMRDSLRLEHARILDAKVSFYDLHNWYMRETDASEAIATERALEDIRIGVYRSFGYEVRGVDKAFFPPSGALRTVRSGIGEIPSLMSEYLKRAGPRLAKLMNVPARLRTSDNTTVYDEAVRAARADISNAKQTASAYRSPDKDPRTFRKGSRSKTGKAKPALGQKVSKEGEVEVWTITSQYSLLGKVSKVGDQASLGYKIVRKGTVLSLYQETKKDKNCTIYSGGFWLLLKGNLREKDIKRFSQNTDIFLTEDAARNKIQKMMENNSHPIVSVNQQKTNPCPGKWVNVPRP